MSWDRTMTILPYKESYILEWRYGNNLFAYSSRKRKSLSIPKMINGTLDDVTIGNEIAFADEENGKLRECIWLTYFVRTYFQGIPVIIFDNHNHALYFWYEALANGIIQENALLIHIDEHSDLWENENIIIGRDLESMWKFTNFSCNVGNYIKPAIKDGLVWNMIRIENEHELSQCMDYRVPKNSILNLDLDFFAPEMDFIEEWKKLQCIRNILPHVRLITIATSPYFIDQSRAIEKLKLIFSLD